MKKLTILLFAAVFLAACKTTDCVGGYCSDVDTSNVYIPQKEDYLAQEKKQTYLSQKGNSAKKFVAKKDTVVVVQKVVVVKEVPKKEVEPKKEAAKVVKPAKVQAPKGETKEILFQDFNGSGEKPYNAILF
jgi:hypothetical protein